MRRAGLVSLGCLALGAVLLWVGGGCGGSGGAGFPGADSGAPEGGRPDGTRPPDATLDVSHGDSPSLGGGPVVSISITPKDPTIVVANGVVPAPTAFTVTGKNSSGGTSTVTGAKWSFDRPDLGSVDGTGAFHASGLVGGVGTLTAASGSLKATTRVTVMLEMTYDPGKVAPTLGPKFKAASTADPLMKLDYPYDKTVFPLGLPAPIPQWCLGTAPACTGSPTDVLHILITTPTATYEAFTTSASATAPSFTIPTTPIDVWTALTSSTTGPMTFSIARYDGTTAYTPQTETWTIAQANLAGTIYYWEINLGTVVKMPLGQGPAAFLQIPTGYTPAITCVACHSVSRNGGTLVAAFNGSASPWGTFETGDGGSIFVDGTDPANGPAGSGFEAISPDGSWVLWGQEQQLASLHLNPSNSATTSATLTPGGAGAYPCQPAWSPDGKHVAYAMRTDGNWLDYTTSSLWTSDVDLTTTPPTFSKSGLVVANTTTRTTTTYPSFSPDTQWIAFERSTQVRSRGAMAEIWLTSLDGKTVISLDAANAGTGLYSQTNANYEPTFMPVAVGGYFWLVFVSERVYGNTLTDITEGPSAGETVGRHKQLWVTAIDATPTAGKDPSHPAFWLPGQNTVDQNMRGEWALDPCKATGATCTAGYDCCAGFCVSTDGGPPVCASAPPGSGCSGAGNACNAGSVCCTGLSCVGGFCNSTVK